MMSESLGMTIDDHKAIIGGIHGRNHGNKAKLHPPFCKCRSREKKRRLREQRL